jgi:hypothetical protein
MADFATALHLRLKNDAAVAAVVGTRIFWVKVPQNAARPYVVLQTISDPRPAHLGGYNGARVTRVQADCIGDTYGAVRTLAEKIITALATPDTVGGVHFGFTKAEGPRDLGEDVDGVGFVHRASLDLLVEPKRS